MGPNQMAQPTHQPICPDPAACSSWGVFRGNSGGFPKRAGSGSIVPPVAIALIAASVARRPKPSTGGGRYTAFWLHGRAGFALHVRGAMREGFWAQNIFFSSAITSASLANKLEACRPLFRRLAHCGPLPTPPPIPFRLWARSPLGWRMAAPQK